MAWNSKTITGRIKHTRTVAAVLLCSVALAGIPHLTAHDEPLAIAAGSVAPAPSSITAVPADTSALISWQPGQTGVTYSIQYGTKSNLAQFTTIAAGTDTTSYRLGGLTNRTAYYYRLVSTTQGMDPLVSAIQTVTPTDAVSAKPTVQVTAAFPNALHITWAGVTRGTAIRVKVGINKAVNRSVFTSALLPVTATAADLTVPAGMLPLIGARTGNPGFVQVNVYNSAAVTQDSTTVPAATPTRVSDAIPVYVPLPPVAGGTPLKIAQYNMQSAAAAVSQSNYPYPQRRTALAAAVAQADPDILVAEELTRRAMEPGSTTTQIADMANLLATPTYGGYALATQTATNNGTPWAGGSSNGVNIFYKPAAVTLLGSEVRSGSSLPVDYPTNLTDQYWAYAKFRTNTAGTVFYVIGTHLAPGADQPTHDLRKRELAAMDAYVSNLAGNAPIIFAGDFNGSIAETNNPEAATLIVRGYVDTATAAQRSGAQYATENQDARPTDRYGYPATPFPYTAPAPRIDYILTKRMVPADAYTNQVILREDGTFDPAYQGSDHNLQLATVRVR